MNRNAKNSGRKRTARSEENIDAVQAALEQNPKGITCRGNGLNLSRATFNRICRIDLRWHPYRMVRRHQLKDGDFERRTAFCEWFLQKHQNPNFIGNFVIGDEAGFAMNGRVSNQNIRMYAPKGQAPDFPYDVNECREKVTVWMGLCGNGRAVGPFFFEGNVNKEKYLELLNESVFPELLNIFGNQFENGYFRRLWWAQDGAPPHRSAEIRQWLSEFFHDHVVALNHTIEWPARSPDLTPCDFFLWGYLKSKVFQTPPDSIDDLKNRIVAEADRVKQNRNLIRRAVKDMVPRAHVCIDRDGSHVEGKLR